MASTDHKYQELADWARRLARGVRSGEAPEASLFSRSAVQRAAYDIEEHGVFADGSAVSHAAGQFASMRRMRGILDGFHGDTDPRKDPEGKVERSLRDLMDACFDRDYMNRKEESWPTSYQVRAAAHLVHSMDPALGTTVTPDLLCRDTLLFSSCDGTDPWGNLAQAYASESVFFSLEPEVPDSSRMGDLIGANCRILEEADRLAAEDLIPGPGMSAEIMEDGTDPRDAFALHLGDVRMTPEMEERLSAMALDVSKGEDADAWRMFSGLLGAHGIRVGKDHFLSLCAGPEGTRDEGMDWVADQVSSKLDDLCGLGQPGAQDPNADLFYRIGTMYAAAAGPIPDDLAPVLKAQCRMYGDMQDGSFKGPRDFQELWKCSYASYFPDPEAEREGDLLAEAAYCGQLHGVFADRVLGKPDVSHASAQGRFEDAVSPLDPVTLSFALSGECGDAYWSAGKEYSPARAQLAVEEAVQDGMGRGYGHDFLETALWCRLSEAASGGGFFPMEDFKEACMDYLHEIEMGPSLKAGFRKAEAMHPEEPKGSRFVLQNVFPANDGKGYMAQISFANDLPQRDGTYLKSVACTNRPYEKDRKKGVGHTQYYTKAQVEAMNGVANKDGDKPVFRAAFFRKDGQAVVDTRKLWPDPVPFDQEAHRRHTVEVHGAAKHPFVPGGIPEPAAAREEPVLDLSGSMSGPGL